MKPILMNESGFDDWAGNYDESIDALSKGYPFEGYYQLLAGIQNQVDFSQNKTPKILDLGVGTGLLTLELYKKGGDIFGLDFSEKMIALAKEKMPKARFLQHDFTDTFPEEVMQGNFDYIISSYAYHHVTDDRKITLLQELKPLLNENGKFAIGDIAFESMEALDDCRKSVGKYWDDAEFYLEMESFGKRLSDAGFLYNFKKVSFCSGVLVVK